MSKYVRSSRSAGSRTVYHTYEDCDFLNNEPRETTEREIEIRNLRICECCANNDGNQGGDSGTEQDHGYQKALKQAAENYESPEEYAE